MEKKTLIKPMVNYTKLLHWYINLSMLTPLLCQHHHLHCFIFCTRRNVPRTVINDSSEFLEKAEVSIHSCPVPRAELQNFFFWWILVNGKKIWSGLWKTLKISKLYAFHLLLNQWRIKPNQKYINFPEKNGFFFFRIDKIHPQGM